jgi:hypothetical protein
LVHNILTPSQQCIERTVIAIDRGRIGGCRQTAHESDSEDERPDRSTSKVTLAGPSHSPTPSATPPPPVDEGLDALNSKIQVLTTITDSHSLLADPDPDTFLRKVIVTRKCQVLNLGESPTRALPLAVGVMRGTLEGIRATCYHHTQDTLRCQWHAGDAVDIDKAIQDTQARIDWNEDDRGRLELQSVYDDQKLFFPNTDLSV